MNRDTTTQTHSPSDPAVGQPDLGIPGADLPNPPPGRADEKNSSS